LKKASSSAFPTTRSRPSSSFRRWTYSTVSGNSSPVSMKRTGRSRPASLVRRRVASESLPPEKETTFGRSPCSSTSLLMNPTLSLTLRSMTRAFASRATPQSARPLSGGASSLSAHRTLTATPRPPPRISWEDMRATPVANAFPWGSSTMTSSPRWKSPWTFATPGAIRFCEARMGATAPWSAQTRFLLAVRTIMAAPLTRGRALHPTPRS